MTFFATVPLVENGRSTTSFKAIWREKIALLTLNNLPIPDAMPVVDERGLPTKDFGQLWKSVMPAKLNETLPMVDGRGLPTDAFTRVWASF